MTVNQIRRIEGAIVRGSKKAAARNLSAQHQRLWTTWYVMKALHVRGPRARALLAQFEAAENVWLLTQVKEAV